MKTGGRGLIWWSTLVYLADCTYDDVSESGTDPGTAVLQTPLEGR